VSQKEAHEDNTSDSDDQFFPDRGSPEVQERLPKRIHLWFVKQYAATLQEDG
jgi:hypothetical protein